MGERLTKRRTSSSIRCAALAGVSELDDASRWAAVGGKKMTGATGPVAVDEDGATRNGVPLRTVRRRRREAGERGDVPGYERLTGGWPCMW